ncbi:alpha-glucuronidase [Pedobacter hiemivivus]|uniref:Xylan alpha-1,2-glucuronidase n=1 Tax=Pedobacter hiemivivus TaxID=2530454 RepID=A0A4U1GHE7_9SPHI|nr:alpha-glucuronidase family glycosyl hydrolase [Pedobacter hiemivivus]TKC63657.1 alpha-glucuronidase [Pedobacter hiemivivus]
MYKIFKDLLWWTSHHIGPIFLLRVVLLLLGLLVWTKSNAENGYDLWLRYKPLHETSLKNNYHSVIKQISASGNSASLIAAITELEIGMKGLLNVSLPHVKTVNANGTLLLGTPSTNAAIARLNLVELKDLGKEGYLIKSVQINGRSCTVIASNTDIGLLYGSYHLLRLIQTRHSIQKLLIVEKPKIQHRVLNHWDNLNGTIERGYAGSSLWDWQRLPGYLDPRYTDYARANASIGINGTVINNVNASAKSLTKIYLVKAAALADVFRPYGIKVYLTARFSAPIEIGGLKTADPLDPEVIKWWKLKVDEIYRYIPDFGGFLVKANSEGQPGPQDYKRSHAEGANMMADALAPHNGVVMWRAFVYENIKGEDRAKQAYQEFKKFDGDFKSNVLLQPKNGPIDFQPREPFHPLFGAMPKTQLMLEFQITQEYLGFATHLVYLAPMFKETLSTDTYAKGKGSTIAKIVEGKLESHQISGIAGVANIGSDINWTGHPFAQSNWYAFGRMAWNPEASPETIADDWLKMTFSTDPSFVVPVKEYMLASREHAVHYMMPLGLNHIMNLGTHYGPGPWDKIPGWNAHDYHLADAEGLGVDRTDKGSNAVEQYFPEVRQKYNDIKSIPPELLLWFHHVPWKYRMPTGKSLWEELVYTYYSGVSAVEKMQNTWDGLKDKVDPLRFVQVKQLLAEQQREAAWWRDGSVLYFQTYSKMPLPQGFKVPAQSLEHYKQIKMPDRTDK